MLYVKINNVQYPAKFTALMADRDWDGRESCSITLSMTYEEAKELFVDNAEWYLVRLLDRVVEGDSAQTIPEPITRDHSEYCVAGDITVHRDGTVTVKMGKMTELEETLAIIYGGNE